MKKFFTLAAVLLFAIASNAQITKVNYRGAFAPTPTPMWTTGWANFDPQFTYYPYSATTAASKGKGYKIIGGASSTVIATNTTWSADTVYEICSLVYVKDGATLTIKPGTIVLGSNRYANSSLIITKGAKLNAIGTQDSAIVFTSMYPAGYRAPGQWGGIVLLGKASYNGTSSATSPKASTYGVNYIEGITEIHNTTTGESTEFGGGASADDNDNSGTLKYVRIEFGGYIFSQNKEINGLTFGAVGRGTTIDNVQCSFINDDAFEWFGGTVNCSHLISYRGVDDEWDTDNGFSGSVQFCLGVRDPLIADASYNLASSGSTSEGYESDNDATGSNNNPRTKAIFSNMTNIGPLRGDNSAANQAAIHPSFRRAARLRRNSQLKIFNSILADYPTGLFIDAAAGRSDSAAKQGLLKFKNNIIAGVKSGGLTEATTFDARAFVLANANDSAGSSADYLVAPYGTAAYPAAATFTAADYRPKAGGLAATGADFTDSSFTLRGNTTTVGAVPADASAIIGKKNISKCDSLQTYSVNNIDSASFYWYVTGTGNSVVSGNGTNSAVIKMKVAGNVSVLAYNKFGSSATSSLSVAKVTPAKPVFVAGAANQKIIGQYNAEAFAWSNVADTFRVKSALGATSYVWSAPAGSTISNVNDTTVAIVFANGAYAGAQSVTVYAKSECDSSSTAALATKIALTTTAAPTPGTIYKSIVGATKVAAVTNVYTLVGGASTTYVINKVANANSYVWFSSNAFATISHVNAPGANDTAITVTFDKGFTSGTISVQSVGTLRSAAKVLAVTALQLPVAVKTVTVTGGTNVAKPLNACIGNTMTFKVATLTPATATTVAPDHYRWIFPATMTVASANADSSEVAFNVNAGFTGGAVAVVSISKVGVTSAIAGLKTTLTHTGCAAGTRIAATERAIVATKTSLYPNPNNGNFRINIESGVAANATIQITDMAGRTVAKYNASSNNLNISNNKLVNGVYFVTYTVGNVSNTIKMVVKK